ncbi:hypothetical protein HanPSC8_Chr07g0289041 [Helianthus annuus]|nr:hypothetical protein HanPSC8_Chr07g0289041 [Helianthus annuus]
MDISYDILLGILQRKYFVSAHRDGHLLCLMKLICRWILQRKYFVLRERKSVESEREF